MTDPNDFPPATWAAPHPGEEPTADARALAALLRNNYVALRREGFTEMQALVMLGTFLGTIGRGAV